MNEPKPNDSRTWIKVTIAVAILGCIGTLGASLIGALPDLLKVVMPTQLTSVISMTENPTSALVPIIVASSIPNSISQPNTECISPQELATQKGWTDMGWADEKYCGLRVNISNSDELPTLWEAIGVKRIYQNDQDRFMAAGVWSIYPPFSCREILECSQ